jgi:general secretion pathway protein E
MNSDLKNPLSDESVCKALVQSRLLSQAQAREIFKKREPLKKKLARQVADKDASTVTIIEVIDSLNIKRTDNPSLPLDEEHIYKVLAQTWHVPYKKVDPLKLDLNIVTSIVPHSFARRHLVLPLAINNGCLTVATPDPFNSELLEDIARASNLEVKAVVSSKREIIKLINEFFGFKRSIAAAENQFTTPLVDLGNLEQYVRIAPDDELPSNDQHIVKAFNHLFTYALDQKASDIHVEPKRDVSLVRLRIDGILHTVYKIPKNVHAAIASRIKNLSRMDMAEKRRPQDGRIKTDKEGEEVEVRVSIVPTAFGEKVVMRIMDPDILFQDLEQLGFTATDLIRFNGCIKASNGIALVCGPTGSGKSTTLYSTLRYLHSPEINITTVEDPIEMIHQDFNQIAVNPVVGIQFGNILRNILRQDPDVIMIGEMRDLETAENAVQAALTGHLVLSTLHTNDAPTSVTRLIDLGIPPFLIQATLRGILAQRLVRKICTHCKEAYVIDTGELADLGLQVGHDGSIEVFRGQGCQQCRGTGYKGRTGIHEVLPYTEAIKKITIEQTDLELLRAQAIKEGMVTLRENAIKKFLSGVTTYQEVLRVTWEQT